MKTKRIVLPMLAGLALASVASAPAMADKDKAQASGESEARQEIGMSGEVRDAWLHGKLETALLFNQHLNSFSIDTDVRNGVAYLYGAVESDIDRDLAGEIAQSIEGVTDVENNLLVDEGKAQAASQSSEKAMKQRSFKQAVSDATLTARVKSQLLLNSNTKGLKINVDSRNGQVILSGEVGSEQEKQLAEMIADNANGEASVDSKLVVKGESS